MRNFLAMKQNCGAMIQDTSASMLALIGNYLNDRLQEVLRRLNLIGTERTDYTVSVTAGTSDYQMPDDFGKALIVRDSTNSTSFTEITSQERIGTYGDRISQNSTPAAYVLLDSLVASQPTSSSVLSVVSDDNTDSGNVHIKFINSSGTEDSETIALVGTSTQYGTKTVSRILTISKDSTSGTVTVKSNSGAVTNAIIAPKATSFRCRIVRFTPTPANSFTANISYLHKFLKMTDDNDIPPIECDTVIEAGAIADAQRYKKMYARAADWEAMFEKRLIELTWDRENSPNLMHRMSPETYNRDLLY